MRIIVANAIVVEAGSSDFKCKALSRSSSQKKAVKAGIIAAGAAILAAVIWKKVNRPDLSVNALEVGACKSLD